jgi:heme-degrading monooxygenase HmoA
MIIIRILILRGREQPVTQITVGQDVVTMINVFAVAPENQQQLIDLLVEGANRVMAKQPGYVAGNIHRSLDGTKVVVYAQWRASEDFQALAQNAEAAEHMRRVRALATFEPVLYDVVHEVVPAHHA